MPDEAIDGMAWLRQKRPPRTKENPEKNDNPSFDIYEQTVFRFPSYREVRGVHPVTGRLTVLKDVVETVDVVIPAGSTCIIFKAVGDAASDTTIATFFFPDHKGQVTIKRGRNPITRNF